MSTKELLSQLNKHFSKESVLTDLEERYAYSFDASYNPDVKTQIADAIVFAECVDDIVKAVKIANEFSVPIVCRGAGTNTVGACVPVRGGIVLNFSKMNKILEINAENMCAKVQPGVIVGDLQCAVEQLGLFYPPDPSNLKVSTIGGSIAQNSAGARSFKYGSTKDYVLDLLVVMADGKVIRTGSNTIKNSAGYNLGSLFVGSEGTLGIVAEATLKLILKPQDSQVVMSYFDNLEDSVRAVNMIIENKIFPSTIDFMDKNALMTSEQYSPAGLLCDKQAALIIEVDGDSYSIEKQRALIIDILKFNHSENIVFSSNKEEADSIWKARRSSMAACARLRPNVTTDDVIVPRSNLAKLVLGVQNICDKYGLISCLVGHVGDGSIHPQIPIDYSDKQEYENYKLAKSEMYKLVIELGGTVSSEHGIGLEKKSPLYNAAGSDAIDYMRTVKKIFDPNNILNPYKIF